MAKLLVVGQEGNEQAVEAKTGMTVMEIIRDAGFDEMLALCGGACSCATCHVQVDPAFFDKLPPMSEDENDLLDSSDQRNENSRLACQLPMSEDLDGMRVVIITDE